MKLVEIQKPKIRRIETNVVVSGLSVKSLNYHNTIVEGNFDCSDTGIRTLDGCPIEVGGYFSCLRTDIKSLKGCPRDVREHFHCHDTPDMTSLKNIHLYIDRIGGVLYLGPEIKSHVLGILRIRDIKGAIDTLGDSMDLINALEFINRHTFKKPNPRDRDIHKCQEEMIEAGLGAYAQL